MVIGGMKIDACPLSGELDLILSVFWARIYQGDLLSHQVNPVRLIVQSLYNSYLLVSNFAESSSEAYYREWIKVWVLSIIECSFEVRRHEDDGVERPGDHENDQRQDLQVHLQAGVDLRELSDPLRVEELGRAERQRQEADADRNGLDNAWNCKTRLLWPLAWQLVYSQLGHLSNRLLSKLVYSNQLFYDIGSATLPIWEMRCTRWKENHSYLALA